MPDWMCTRKKGSTFTKSFNNVIVTSHQAFFTKEAMANIAHTTLQNVKDFAEGRPLVNEVVAS